MLLVSSEENDFEALYKITKYENDILYLTTRDGKFSRRPLKWLNDEYRSLIIPLSKKIFDLIHSQRSIEDVQEENFEQTIRNYRNARKVSEK